jgi:hypothetical protein
MNIITSVFLSISLITSIISVSASLSHNNSIILAVLLVVLLVPAGLLGFIASWMQINKLYNLVKHKSKPDAQHSFSKEFHVEIATRFAYYTPEEQEQDDVEAATMVRTIT